MKIRRILATAVAAAVTTPVVFLSAAPAFADTKPSPSPTQKSTLHDEDPEDMPSLEELKAAVALAQKAYDEAVVELAKATADVESLTTKADHPLAVAAAAAKTAATEAAAAKTAADEKLAKAEQTVKDLEADAEATPEQKADAAAAVTVAKTAAEQAAVAKTAADTKAKEASEALDEARVQAFRVLELAKKVKKAAAEDLAEAQEELKFFEEIGGECVEDSSVKVALSGPKTVTAGQPAIFSLRVTNTSDAPLDAVHAFADALRIPEDDEVIDDETDFADRMIPVEWSSADNLEWTSFTEEFDSIEIGKLAKGDHYDVKLRLTVAADATAGKGAAFSYAEYETNDGDCGMGDYSDVTFDILAAKGDKPEPTPTPSATTTTPTPAPSTAGNTNTTPQGGSSTTRVNGTLAATGADDTLPLGLAAGAAVALGAGAVFFARRRKADANA